MSIKKLFDTATNDLQYSDYKTQKEAFEPVESARNAEAIHLKQNTFVPQIDYAEPENFARYGSGYLYYSGAMNRIIDFYPYDGSKAEKNEFYNKLLEVEKYVFDKLYPKSTGYAILSPDGYTGVGPQTDDGYGTPNSYEYITLKGGPGTGSAGSSLVSKGSNPYSDKFTYSNVYDTSIYITEGLPSDYGKGTRQSNLKANFDTGVTIEFWLKKPGFATGTSQKEVVFDLWNSASYTNPEYGRLTITLQGADAGATPFLVTAQSGTISASFVTQSIGTGLTPSSLQSWGHYAFVLQNSGSMLKTKLYVNGYLNDTTSSFSSGGSTSGSLGEITGTGATGSMIGRIGALLTNPTNIRWQAAVPPSASSARNGDARLSASLDEFRYWKVARDAKQIGENWFTHVGGGTNRDISNTTLGVYYKFNEGITGTDTIDDIVLDYAGRVTNGAWTGYASTHRNTGSAIVSASAASREIGDPIMRASNTLVSTLKTNLLESGSFHDLNNNSQFLNYAPSWVIEDHENEGNDNLKIISHIMGTYFDKMYLLTSQLPGLRQLNYTTASHAPVPFASHLPQSIGLYSPEIFVDATILERFENRTEKALFESQLNEAKNLIYLNLYNNLTSIYKSKGTEKALRNVLRCFNLDDSLVRLKVYNKNHTYQLKNNIAQYMLDRSALDYNQSGNISAVVYQAEDTTNANSRGYLSASRGTTGKEYIEAPFGATIEASLTFPKFFSGQDKFDRTFITSSLFGLYEAKTGSADERTGVITTTRAYDRANFQVMAVRDSVYSKNVYFKLTSSIDPNPFPTLRSDVFLGVYDDSDWNISVRLRPTIYPLTTEVSGTGAGLRFGYDVVFRGINTILGTIRNSFEVSGAVAGGKDATTGWIDSYTSGSSFLRAAKRLYVGARRTNITGAVINQTDVRFHNVKYWTKFIGNTSLDQHLYDPENAGVSGSYRDISPKDAESGQRIKHDLTNARTLALEWNFGNVTTSDGTGNFITTDFSSGSYAERTKYGWLGNVVGWQHSGYGYGFPASDTKVVQKQLTNMYKFIDPEQAVSADMIQILDKDDEVFGVVETVPNFIYTIEKSQYEAISEEMLKFFAGVIDFNNVIGEPINRYRDRYKTLEKLRQAFFRRVTTITEVEKFVEYYKWFDDAISEIISQLVPASSDLITGILNTIEPTVLERPKYETKYPTLEAKPPDPEGVAVGEAGATWDARAGTSPVESSPRDTRLHIPFWKNRAIRSAAEISADRFVGAAAAAIIDAQREKFRKVIVSAPHMSRSAPTFFDVGTTSLYTGNEFRINTLARLQKFKVHRDYNTHGALKGGTNFDANKNIHFTYAALHPGGPIDQAGGRFVPQNILLAFMEDIVKLPYDNDPKLPTEKIKRYLKVHHGRGSTSGADYEDAKSSIVFPFNLISPVTQSDTLAGNLAQKALKTGYQKEVYEKLSQSIAITNLHNDVYGSDMEVPLQGPFTNYAVGGHQSRHVAVNYSSSTRPLDTWSTRPEAWKILLGRCIGPSGAIGMVGPDYPTPDGNTASSPPYPATLSQKAIYYRDMIAKSPVNIRNIRLTTGSTILGNYRQTREIVQSVGAWSNPRHFIDNQPALPSNVFQNNATGATSTNTILDMPRFLRAGTVPATIEDQHFTFVDDYSTSYLTGNIGSSIIINRFSNFGGPEVESRGHQDFRSTEYSVYNSLNFKNLMVTRPSQGPSGSHPECHGIRISDIHNSDYGLRSHLSRHTARFGRDSVALQTVPYDLTTNMRITCGHGARAYSGKGGLQAWWRLNENVSSAGIVHDHSGYGRTGSFDAAGDRPGYSTVLYPSQYIQIASCTWDGTDDGANIGSEAEWNNIIGTGSGGTSKMAISGWIYKGGDGGGGTGRIISFGQDDIALYGSTSDRLYMAAEFTTTDAAWYTDSSAIQLSGWDHIVMSYDATTASNTPDLYINGAPVSWNAGSTVPVGDFYGIGGTDCAIGNRAAGDRAFKGQLADIAVWNTTLTADDAKALYMVSSSAGDIRGLPAPGATYDQLPGFHKVHRNNLQRIKPVETITYGYSTVSYENTTGLLYEPTNYAPTLLAHTTTGISALVGAVTGSTGAQSAGFTWTGWLNFGAKSIGAEEPVFSLGVRDGPVPAFTIAKKLNNPNIWTFFVRARTQDTLASPTAESWLIASASWTPAELRSTPWTGSWNHFAVTWHADVDGAIGGTNPAKIYFNGVEQALDVSGSGFDYFANTAATVASVRAFGSISAVNNDALFIGGDFGAVNVFSGSMDEVTIWKQALNASDISKIYNNGFPCDITQSSPYLNGAPLYDWIPFQSGVDVSEAVIRNTNPGTWSSGVNSVVGQGGNQYLPVAMNGGNNDMVPTVGPPGCVPVITGATTTTTYITTDNVYDNFFVKHPIPRSSRQYKWLTGALVSDRNWIGFTPRDFMISSSTGGTVGAYQFVSESDFGTYKDSGTRTYGATSGAVAAADPAYVAAFAPNPPTLNTTLTDLVDSDTNTLGYATTTPLYAATSTDSQYANRTFVGTFSTQKALFNALMTKRSGFFGYPTWQQMRHADNPILQAQRKANVVSMVSHTLPRGELARYNMPPVSMEGRPVVANFDLSDGKDVTAIATHNNESVYFTSVDMSNEFDIDFDSYDTPFEQLVRSVRNLNVSPLAPFNWVMYTQKLFPSVRNEFTSGSNERLNYDNRFWRAGRVARDIKNAVTASLLTDIPSTPSWLFDFFENGNFASVNPLNQWVKESSWPLDAPNNFMSRSGPPSLSKMELLGKPNLLYVFVNYKGQTGSAGVLQNTYTNFFSGTAFTGHFSAQWKAEWADPHRILYSTAGPLYARKHLISNPRSFVSRTGITNIQTGGMNIWDGPPTWTNNAWLTGNWVGNQIVPIGGGEALWEAGETAGVMRKVPSTVKNASLGTYESEFQLSASEPWFDTYGDFRYQLKLMAKDYAIVPEYRISEHIDEYEKYGMPNTLELEIPGALRIPLNPTSSVASISGQPNFYVDYSNSEFLQDFLKIREDTLLNARQIRLVCSAAIRFNPYKGFYPAQRTVQLVEQFRTSYESCFNSFFSSPHVSPGSDPFGGDHESQGGTAEGEMFFPTGMSSVAPFPMMGAVLARPIANALFSPGLLYNSIKSGLAVDYPIARMNGYTRPEWHGGNSTGYNDVARMKIGTTSEQNYALSFGPTATPVITVSGGSDINRSFFEKRIPFEALLDPAGVLDGTIFYDMEPNPSASVHQLTGTFSGDADDAIYEKMAKNFFGQVGEFFLKGEDYTSIKSDVVTSDQRFEAGQVFMGRVKLRRSISGSRNYISESVLSPVYHTWSVNPYGRDGGLAYNQDTGSTAWTLAGYGPSPEWSFHSGGIGTGSTFPLPQDPVFSNVHETFTMYSRPSAFGPALAGRAYSSSATHSEQVFPLDSFNGFNWAYTPPYYNGEGWVDLVFRPSHTKSYDLDQIMAETKAVHWRVDAGQMSGAYHPFTHAWGTFWKYNNRLIHGDYPTMMTSPGMAASGAPGPSVDPAFLSHMWSRNPYSGNQLNRNAMQVTAAINIFGIEDVPFTETTKYPPVVTTHAAPSGKRWVIKPKFETPMLNFNDQGTRPLTNPAARAAAHGGQPDSGKDGYPADPLAAIYSTASYISVPAYMSASVPRGMWHQFGVIPDKPSVGVFMEIGDIPRRWLRNHYLMLNTGSIYNDYIPTLTGGAFSPLWKEVKSLPDLVGFRKKASSRRLGELAESRTLREAVVAVPYILETIEVGGASFSAATFTRKKFVEIPPERFRAAMSGTLSAEGDSLDAAGASIRKQLQKMKRYVIPPNMDFLNDDRIPPYVMYLFEFEYKLDRDDLSYIWQNIAPRNYKKITFEAQSVAHELVSTELLDESILAENENLRWMVFKVKQRATKTYWDLIPGQVSSEIATPKYAMASVEPPESPLDRLQYNWPYDYVSFVELIKMDAEILYKPPEFSEMSAEELADKFGAGGGIPDFGETGGGTE